MAYRKVDHHTEQLTPTRAELSACVSAASQAESVNSEVIAELFRLLEGYAPVWYTEQLHLRLESALKSTVRL
jgi:hypothetical protein